MFDKPTRNHPYFIFERGGALALVLLFYLGSNIVGEQQADVWKRLFSADYKAALAFILEKNLSALLLAAVGIPVLCLFVIAVSFLIWRRTTFYIDKDDNFRYDHRGLVRKEIRVPLRGISTVNIRRSLFKRLFGLAAVRLDVNSAVTSEKADFSLVMTAAQAEVFARTIEAKKAEAAGSAAVSAAPSAEAAASVATDAAQRREIRYTPGQVFVHILLTASFAAPVVILLMWLAQFLPVFAGEAETISLLPLLVIVVAGILFAALKQFLTLYGYTVSADRERVTLSHGLLNRQSYTFELKKINAVVVHQSLLARLCKRAYVEVVVIGYGDAKARPRLCLYASLAEVERIRDALTGDFGDFEAPQKLARAGFWQKQLVLLLWALAAFGLIGSFSPLWGAAAAVFLLLWGTLSHKLASVATSIAFAEHGFRYTCGIFKKATRFVRYGDVQQAEFRANRVQQRLGNAKLSFVILSAAAERRTATGYFPESALEALAAHIVKARDTSTKLWE